MSLEQTKRAVACRVIQVDTGATAGADGDEIVQKLLVVESVDEPTAYRAGAA